MDLGDERSVELELEAAASAQAPHDARPVLHEQADDLEDRRVLRDDEPVLLHAVLDRMEIRHGERRSRLLSKDLLVRVVGGLRSVVALVEGDLVLLRHLQPFLAALDEEAEFGR